MGWITYCLCCCYTFRSRGVASVTAAVSFNPDKISVLSKPCDNNGRKVSCFNANVCFRAAFRPKNPVGPMGKRASRRTWTPVGLNKQNPDESCSRKNYLSRVSKECVVCSIVLISFRYNLHFDPGR